MKKIKRISAIVLTVIFLSSFFAIPVHAVDPISAAAIANGFAQAITAYGASNGVSLIFDGIDSNNTSQIGEAVHDLWSRFRADQQTTDDYLAIGEALMPSLFYKAEKAAGAAAIGISIAQEYMPDIDEFWNWVLSGPAEMVKVDNAFQWTVDSTTGEIITPAVYHSLSINAVSVPNTTSNYYSDWNNLGLPLFTTSSYGKAVIYGSQDVYVYAISGSSPPTFVFVSLSNDAQVKIGNGTSANGWSTNLLTDDLDSSNGFYYAEYTPRFVATVNSVIPLHTVSDLDYSIDTTRVAPYVGDAVAKPVPIPDTADPDYGPIPWVGDLDIPWNDTLFGDGTGTLTNEQTGDIIGTIDQAIAANPDKTLELVGEQDIPVNPEPSEIIIPFLPVEVPSFNFSLSGIWHYVREWVSSLGAWFALVFTVWGILPYALVVPVYATAVIVIVLGVYKRFFM